MDDSERATILALHDRGEVSETAARELLGDSAFDLAQRKAVDTECMLDEDTGDYPTDAQAEPNENREVEQLAIDTSHITEHSPSTDIDQYVEDSNFRIERMGETGLWICAYTHDDGEADHHYEIYVDDGGLHVTHREEDNA